MHTAHVNIILKSFDGDPNDKAIQERALQGFPIGTCISIADHPNLLPDIAAKEHIWMAAGPLRDGQYEGTDWNTITPLDGVLIEAMRRYEAVFMTMITRYAHERDIPYDERKRQYFDHLRFWNHELEARNIEFVLMNHPPHQCYDWVLYGLCKLKGIPVLYLERNLTVDAMFLVEDWEESTTDLRDRLQELRREYADPAKPVPLSQHYEAYWKQYREQKPLPWYKPVQPDPGKQNLLRRWVRPALKTLFRNPRKFFSSIISGAFWSRKLEQHRVLHFYDRHTSTPDLSQPYVYVPLHYQPEATTWPQAGAFGDQERVVQMLAACLPPGIRILVKEHPMQGEVCRSKAFYRSLLDLPSVIFVPKSTNTFELISRSVAVASGVGSAIFEAMMRNQPSFMFGFYFYQYAPGVYPIRTLKDCQEAVRKIFVDKERHTEREIRLFLRATEECATPFALSKRPPEPGDPYTEEEKVGLMGDFIARRIRKMIDRKAIGQPRK